MTESVRGSGAQSKLRNLPVALIVLGVILRGWAGFAMDVQQDGATYTAMGHAFQQHGEFLMPWGDTIQRFESQPAYSHHYSPLYPLMLAGGYAVAGYSLEVTKAVALLVSLASIAVVWWCTRDLFGRERANWVTGILAVEPGFILATGTGFTENLVLLLFAGTLWAIIKSLREPSYIVVAGVCAGLGYLTRSGMGALFIVAGLGGLGWRLMYRGRETFKDNWYLLAGLIFGTMVAAWGLRNLVRFGDWQTSLYTSFSFNYAFHNQGLFWTGLLGKVPIFFAFMALYWMPFSRELKEAGTEWRREERSVLWLCIGLVLFIGWVMATVYWTVEQSPMWWMDQHRYVVVAFLPLLWLAASKANFSSRNLQLRTATLAAVLVVASVGLILEPQVSPLHDAAAHLDLHAGSQVGMAGALDKYKAYPYFQLLDIQVYDCQEQGYSTTWGAAQNGSACAAKNPDFILSTEPLVAPGYALLRTSEQSLWFGLTSLKAYTYGRVPA